MSAGRAVVLVLTAILLASDVARAQRPTPGYQRCRMYCGIAETVRRQCCYRYNICCLMRDELYGSPYAEPALPYIQHDLHLDARLGELLP
uniref:Putative secreted protein n=1 Tax=Rhipicephalus microplus TaxID=6941 RepID=A0A6M2DB19_RHIMP